MSKRILVTGANGFVGTALCHKLLAEKKYSVRAAVRSSQKLMSLPDNIEFCVVGDIGPDTEWKKSLENIDVIIHLAGRAHITESINREYYKVNTQGTGHLAKMAVETGVRRFIYISSVKVNGEYVKPNSQGEIPPFSEEDIPQPQDDYAVSKWKAEQLLRQIEKDTGLEVAIIRSPLIYGSGVKANFLSLLKLVDSGLPLPFASIKNRRSFIYLGNLIDIISICITHPKAAGQTFLVSDSENISTPALIRKIADAMECKVLLIPFPISFLKFLGKISGRLSAIERLTQSLCIDNTKIVTALNWISPYTLEEGLKLTVDSYRQNEKSL